MAHDRILVLDDYLFKPRQEGQSRQSRYDQILEWVPHTLIANNIRFLTNEHEDRAERVRIRDLFNARALAIKQGVPRRSGEPRIEIKFTLQKDFPYVHDRFAIIDDELWHFGATVGGLHHHVNAATRGWDAEVLGAVRFFNEAWKGDTDAQRRGHRG